MDKSVEIKYNSVVLSLKVLLDSWCRNRHLELFDTSNCMEDVEKLLKELGESYTYGTDS